MLTHYPALKVNETYRLKVSDEHELYIEESGNPDGIPVILIHGGPGSGCHPQQRCFFDPENYRIILYDQRSAGQSTPHASLENNTTQDLIADLEAIRELLNIEKWLVFGSSWGSTLSLVYAQAHPQRVFGLLLRAIFLARQQDIEWILDGTKKIFPEHWQEFIKPLSTEQQSNILQSYFDLLTGEDELLRMSAVKAWAKWEALCSTLEPKPQLVEQYCQPFSASSRIKLQCHYFLNNCFLEENQILNNMEKIEHLPAIIIHGRYDMFTLLEGAWQLQQKWPGANLTIVRDAGHSSQEPAAVDAIIRATREFAKKFSQ